MDPRQLLKLVLISGLGNVLEWFDFAVFGFFAPQIGKAFFPPQAGDSRILESFAVFAGAFVMRPIGGLIFGYIGDTYGRKRSLFISILTMAIATFSLGCLPTFEQVGVAAPIMLTFVRLVQGVSVGGQLVGTFVYVVESAPPAQRCFFGSLTMGLANLGTLSGSAVGGIIQAATTTAQLEAWGWRIPFLAGILVGVSGYYLEGLAENPEFTNAAAAASHAGRAQAPWKVVVREYKKPLLVCFTLSALWCLAIYTTLVWSVTLLDTLRASPIPDALLLNTGSALVILVGFPLFGFLADRHGPLRVMVAGAVGLALSFAPFLLLDHGQPWLVVLGQAILFTFVSMWGAPLPTYLVLSFPAEYRFTAVALCYNLAQAMFGGTAPLVQTALYSGAKSAAAPAAYLGVVALAAIPAVIAGMHPSMPESSALLALGTGAGVDGRDTDHTVSSVHPGMQLHHRLTDDEDPQAGAAAGGQRQRSTELTSSIANSKQPQQRSPELSPAAAGSGTVTIELGD